MSLSLDQLDLIRECSKDAAAYERLRALYDGLSSPHHASPPAANTANSTKTSFLTHLYDALPTKILDAMQDMLSISSVDGTVHYASPSHQRVLGYPLETFVNGTIFDHVHPDDLPKIMAQYQHSLASGVSEQVEFRCRHADGHYIWLQTRGDLLYDEEGKLSGALFISRDITDRKKVEEELRQSEIRLRLLTDNIDDMLSLIDLSGKALYVSPSHERALGHAIDFFNRDTLYLELHPDDAEGVQEWFSAVYQQQDPGQHVYRYKHADGSYRWLETVGSLSRDEQGQIQGVILVSRDITERKQIEEDLRESEARLRMLTDNVNDMLSMVKPDGTILYVSPSHERVLGYPPGHYTRQTLMEHLHPDDTAGAVAWLREVYSGQTTPPPFVYRYRHISGSYLWLEAAATVIYDKAGKVDRVIIVTRDISSRKESEAELQEKQHFIERVANASPYMIYVFDLDTQMSIYNNRATRLFYNLNVEEMRYWQEERLAANFHPDDLPRAGEMYQRLLAAPDHTVVEEQLRMGRHDGAWRWMHLWLVVFKRRADSSVQQILGLCMDITEQRESQEIRLEHEHLRAAFLKEQELSDLKTRMMRRISHEFRTPLAVINAAAEMLDFYGERHTPEQRVERYQQIYTSVEHMTAMLNDMSFIIKDLTRTRSINSLPVQMTHLCETLIASLRPQLDIQHQVILEAEADLKPVAGDPELLEHALTHLLKNAVNYSPNKTPIHLTLQKREQYLLLTIRDTGIGILQHEQERVLEPFFRGSNIPESMGLGLGLTIAQKIIEAHSGSLLLESKIGSGTTVSVYLPSL